MALSTLGFVHLAAGAASAAREAWEAARKPTGMISDCVDLQLGGGGAVGMRRSVSWTDDVVAATKGCLLSVSLASRARVEFVQCELDAAERDGYEALDLAARLTGDLVVPYALDGLAIVASEAGNHLAAAQLFGAADAARPHMGVVRFKVLEGDGDARIAALGDAIGETNFDAPWVEGSALSIEEAIRLRAAWVHLAQEARVVAELYRLAAKARRTPLFCPDPQRSLGS